MKRLLIVIALLAIAMPGMAALQILDTGTGQVELAWDHSVSADVTGYKMYVGTAPGTYVRIDPVPYQKNYTVENLPDGTYYFAVTAIDAAGNESGFSNEVTTMVDTVPPEPPGNLNILQIIIAKVVGFFGQSSG